MVPRYPRYFHFRPDSDDEISLFWVDDLRDKTLLLLPLKFKIPGHDHHPHRRCPRRVLLALPGPRLAGLLLLLCPRDCRLDLESRLLRNPTNHKHRGAFLSGLGDPRAFPSQPFLDRPRHALGCAALAAYQSNRTSRPRSRQRLVGRRVVQWQARLGQARHLPSAASFRRRRSLSSP